MLIFLNYIIFCVQILINLVTILFFVKLTYAKKYFSCFKMANHTQSKNRIVHNQLIKKIKNATFLRSVYKNLLNLKKILHHKIITGCVYS